MKKKLYLVRHGQTAYNIDHLLQGWCNSDLTPLGHQQAIAVKKWLNTQPKAPQSFYCSTLGRTKETLEDITDQPYTALDGLREHCYGSLEGQEVSKALPEGFTYNTSFAPYGGESPQEVTARMTQTLEKIMETDPNDVVLALSHGISSYRFAHAVDPKKAEALRKTDNCVIYDFDWEDGKFTLNDIINKHLAPLKNSQ